MTTITVSAIPARTASPISSTDGMICRIEFTHRRPDRPAERLVLDLDMMIVMASSVDIRMIDGRT